MLVAEVDDTIVAEVLCLFRLRVCEWMEPHLTDTQCLCIRIIIIVNEGHLGNNLQKQIYTCQAKKIVLHSGDHKPLLSSFAASLLGPLRLCFRTSRSVQLLQIVLCLIDSRLQLAHFSDRACYILILLLFFFSFL